MSDGLQVRQALDSVLWIGNNLHNYGSEEFRELLTAAIDDCRTAKTQLGFLLARVEQLTQAGGRMRKLCVPLQPAGLKAWAADQWDSAVAPLDQDDGTKGDT